MVLPLWAIQFLAGGMGGLVRGIVGVTKAQTFLPADATHQALQAGNPDTFKFQWKYFTITVIVSMIVGQMAGLIANADWRMSLLAGYAGSDFLESTYKLSVARFLNRKMPAPYTRSCDANT
jgi:hypothetical protein